MSITAKDVMALRQETDMPMMKCKQALTEAGGDKEKAKEMLREEMKGKMAKRTERTTGEGRLAVKAEGAAAVIIEILTESDFTARNEKFVAMVDDVLEMAFNMGAGNLTADDAINARVDDIKTTTGENMSFSRGVKLEGGCIGSYLHHDAKRAVIVQVDGDVDEATLKGICQHIVALDPKSISEDDVDAAILEQVRVDAIQEAKDGGKPEEIAQKMADGKVRRYLQDHTLVNQKYVLDESKTIKELLGGNTVKAFVRYTLGESA